MNKSQAIYKFWNSFDIPAYDENTVPDTAKMPYITFSTATDNIDHPISLTASIWQESTSWQYVEDKAEEIAKFIGYGGYVIKLDNGYLYITRGTPFAQRVSDPVETTRRIYINLMAEFLTAI